MSWFLPVYDCAPEISQYHHTTEIWQFINTLYRSVRSFGIFVTRFMPVIAGHVEIHTFRAVKCSVKNSWNVLQKYMLTEYITQIYKYIPSASSGGQSDLIISGGLFYGFRLYHSGKAYEGTCRIPRQNGDGRGIASARFVWIVKAIESAARPHLVCGY